MVNNISPKRRQEVGLPPRPFLYTLEQIYELLAINPKELEGMLYYDKRTLGVHRKSMMMVRNLARPDQEPIWRVADAELVRWLRAHRFRIYERFVVRD